VQRASDLKAGEVDDLLDQAVSRVLSTASGARNGPPPPDRRWPPGRLGKQGQPAHGRLELVADVDDEVTANVLDPSCLSAIINQ